MIVSQPVWSWIATFFQQRTILWSLLVINFLGSIYGFYWYKNQLAVTPPQWLIFVPDSPTASAFFTVVLLLYLMGRKSPLLEAFAAITLFKYGIWAVMMIIWGAMTEPVSFFEALTWQHWMLMGSHLGMALEAFLFVPFYTYKIREILIVSAWTLLNDALDYGVDIHPWLAPGLEPIDHIVGIFTVSLSMVSILLFIWLYKSREGVTAKGGWKSSQEDTNKLT
jgi:uncharacterized membrane protein YpjA